MKKTILAIAFVAVCQLTMADATQQVTISGTTVEGEVASLTFDGDNVVVAFADGTTQSVDMGELSILLTYSDNSGIAQIESEVDPAKGKIYNLAGQYVGNDTKSLSRGIYIVNGKKILVK